VYEPKPLDVDDNIDFLLSELTPGLLLRHRDFLNVSIVVATKLVKSEFSRHEYVSVALLQNNEIEVFSFISVGHLSRCGYEIVS